MNYTMVLPSDYLQQTSKGKKYPVLYLLHAAGGHDTQWIGKEKPDTDLRSLVDSVGFLIAIPDDSLRFSWWLDSPIRKTHRFSTYLATEFKRRIDSLYATLPGRTTTGIAGHSMGGFGALNNLARFPDLYGSACGMVAAVNIIAWPGEFQLNSLLGDPGAHGPNWDDATIVNHPERYAGLNAAIRLYAGIKDPLFLEDNRKLHKAFLKSGVNHDYIEFSGGHEYFPNSRLLDMLRFFEAAFQGPSTAATIPFRSKYQAASGLAELEFETPCFDVSGRIRKGPSPAYRGSAVKKSALRNSSGKKSMLHLIPEGFGTNE